MKYILTDKILDEKLGIFDNLDLLDDFLMNEVLEDNTEYSNTVTDLFINNLCEKSISFEIENSKSVYLPSYALKRLDPQMYLYISDKIKCTFIEYILKTLKESDCYQDEFICIQKAA